MSAALDRQIATHLLDWYEQCARDLPWRRTSDPYAIWVSEVMLQQTQVKTVVSYWERWMARFPDIQSLAAAPEAAVLKHWEGLGYYRRARHLQAAARHLIAENRGEFPTDLAGVLELRGIGRYTAGAICSIAFNQPTPIVDGNVARVLARWEMLRGDVRRAPRVGRLWERADALVNAAARTGRPHACSHFNQALMELGALVCTPKAPACGRCPVASECQAHAEGKVAEFPQVGQRQPPTERFFEVLVIQCGDRYAVRQRAEGDVNGGFWEFPCLEVASLNATARGAVTRILTEAGLRVDEGRVRPGRLMPLATVRHAITRYRILQRASLVNWPGVPPRISGGLVWRTREALDQLAFTAAHRKLVQRLPRGSATGSI
ncbi:MAG: A/G-specific adenine glycosylase [Verrucomicrobiales bacterium]|nr:A/G-specific adenine glycosylase [Verrucomicrobiales bacterium]